MSYKNPTLSDFKAYFYRDFPYGFGEEFVQDVDICTGMSDCAVIINQGLFPSQDFYSKAFMLLSAHFMVMNLRASSQGVAGQYDWMVTSKAVGSVSEGVTVPQRVLDNPELAMLSKTPYGAKYLMMILPYLSGQVFTVAGATHP